MIRFACLAMVVLVLNVGNAAADMIVLDANAIANVISGPVQTDNFGGGPFLMQPAVDNNQGLLGFELSSIKLPVKSATLKVYQDFFGIGFTPGTGLPPGTYDIYRNTSPWAQNVVTWNTKPGVDPKSVATLPLSDSAGWRSWNVTSLVNGWVTGNYGNFGLTIGRSDAGMPEIFLVTIQMSSPNGQAEAPPQPGTGFPTGPFPPGLFPPGTAFTPELILDVPHDAPEPTSLVMAGIAALGLLGWRCRGQAK